MSDAIGAGGPYIVAVGDTIPDLVREVQYWYRHDYIPVGGVVVDPGGRQYVQAMYREPQIVVSAADVGNGGPTPY